MGGKRIEVKLELGGGTCVLKEREKRKGGKREEKNRGEKKGQYLRKRTHRSKRCTITAEEGRKRYKVSASLRRAVRKGLKQERKKITLCATVGGANVKS